MVELQRRQFASRPQHRLQGLRTVYTRPIQPVDPYRKFETT